MSAAYGPEGVSCLTNSGDVRLSSRGTDCLRKVKQMPQPRCSMGGHNAARGSPHAIGKGLSRAGGRTSIELWIFLLALAAAPVPLIASVFLLGTQTVIEVPAAGQDVPLSHLSYKARAFEAKVTSVRLEPRGAADADPFVADWSFLGSNSDGQMHRLEIQLRLQDESGKQLAMPSHYFALAAGARNQSLKLETKLTAAVWKATRKVRIVVNWIN